VRYLFFLLKSIDEDVPGGKPGVLSCVRGIFIGNIKTKFFIVGGDKPLGVKIEEILFDYFFD